MSDPTTRDELALDAFRRALESRQDEIAAEFAKHFRSEVSASVMSDAQIDVATMSVVKQYLAVLADGKEDVLRDANAGWARRMFARGLSTTKVHALSAAIRQVWLDVGLDLRRAGTPGATLGIRRLVAASRVAVQMFDDIFRERAAEALRTAAIFEALFETSPYSVAVASPDGTLRFANASFHKLLGFPSVMGRTIDSLHAPEDVERARNEIAPAVLDLGIWHGPLHYKHANGSSVPTLATAFRLQNAEGETIARCAIIRDVGVALQAEEERRALMNELIAAQQRTIDERETPLVPIAEGILVMPLVGTIDALRAERMLAVLLEGIDVQRASVVLMDWTGVKAVDQASASAILRATQAARLLGADVALTGIRPEIARTFVEVNANFGGIEMKGSLGEGVRWALKRMGHAGKPSARVPH